MTSIPFHRLEENLSGDLFTDKFHRCLLSTDGSIFREVPACVVYPKNTADAAEAVRFARKHGLTVHPRGAGSGLCGASLGPGIVIDFSRHMNRLLELNPEQKYFVCQPGYRMGELERKLAGKGLFFPPDPSSGEYASFGGMYGTNASGAHSVKYGNVADYILDAEVVTGKGEVLTLSEVRSLKKEELPAHLRALHDLYTENRDRIENAYPAIPCNVAGYNLRGLVQKDALRLERLYAGAEGTLGIVTRLKFRLLDKPAADSLAVAFFDEIVASARAVQELLPLHPSGIEVMDKSLLRLARESDPALKEQIPDGVDNVLLIEFDGPEPEECAEAARKAKHLLQEKKLAASVHSAVSIAEKERFWAVRKAAVPILYKLKGSRKILALMEDAAVPTDRLVDYFQGIYQIFEKHSVPFVTYGHIAKGLLHTRPLLNLKDPKDVGLLRVLADELFELVHSLGGVVSGEHGDGRLRTPYIRRQYGEIYDLFLKTKSLLDEAHLFNPAIKTGHDPDQMSKNLRYGDSYRSSDPGEKMLLWPEGWITEIEKCHGCSKCTTVTTATRMCPIYKFTREEAAAPKAKANLLRAMISGAVSDRSLYETAFTEVMDRCVNCGSCAKECPSGVNIPKMAMEARARYVRRFGPSLESRLLTSLEFAGRTAGKISPLITRLAGNRILRTAGEKLTGIAAEREMIRLSGRSLFERLRPEDGKGGPRILYFAGCYAGYVRPEIGEAAVTVLKHLGMRVLLPPQHCCGLPMLSKGMISAARKKIRHNLSQWGELPASVDAVAVTCSSCGYALMKDWADVTDDPGVQTVSAKVMHISRLIRRFSDRLQPVPVPASYAYHAPCHLKIQPDPESSVSLISRMPGASVTDLKSHCCGMIGSWGMSASHYELSRKIGSAMIGKLNRSDADFGITDCPTCRMQMEAFGNKPVLHPVEVVARHIHEPGIESTP